MFSFPVPDANGGTRGNGACLETRRSAERSLLRLQCMDDEEARREAAVYAAQSGEVRLGGRTKGVAVEQFRFYLLDEAGPVRVNEGWGEISFRGRV